MVEHGNSKICLPSSTLERFLTSFFFVISKVCFLIQNCKRCTLFFERQEHFITNEKTSGACGMCLKHSATLVYEMQHLCIVLWRLWEYSSFNDTGRNGSKLKQTVKNCSTPLLERIAAKLRISKKGKTNTYQALKCWTTVHRFRALPLGYANNCLNIQHFNYQLAKLYVINWSSL